MGAEYKLRLILSCSQLKFWRLDTICSCLECRRLDSSYDWVKSWPLDTSFGWLHPTAYSSSGGWIRVVADSILQLTRVPAAGYELQLTPSYGWLEFRRLDRSYRRFILWLTGSCGWFYSMADSSSAGWTRNVADLYFNISSEFKDLFCKIHLFLLSTAWFQLPLFQTLAAASRTLKKLEEAWRSFKTLAVTDSSCSGWFELWRLIRDLRPFDYL